MTISKEEKSIGEMVKKSELFGYIIKILYDVEKKIAKRRSDGEDFVMLKMVKIEAEKIISIEVLKYKANPDEWFFEKIVEHSKDFNDFLIVVIALDNPDNNPSIISFAIANQYEITIHLYNKLPNLRVAGKQKQTKKENLFSI